MAEKIAKLGLKRDKDHLLYVKDAKVYAAPMRKEGSKSKKHQVASFAPHEMSKDHVYFVDKDGDVSRAKRAKRGAKQKRK